MSGCDKFDIVIVGGGSAGITVAAQFRRRAPQLSVAIIEPGDRHWYQPGFTLVGSGVFSRAQTERREEDLIPAGVKWLRAAAATFDPAADTVALEDGRTIGYRSLIVCPGLKLDWDKIEGLGETIGRNGVCSNYLPQYADYTWKCVQGLSGGNAIFTQPAMPIKCAGAPQKIMYLTADNLRKRGLLSKTNVEFCLAGDAMFGVAYFVPALLEAVEKYGINVNYKTMLTRVDGDARKAYFRAPDATGNMIDTVKSFDMLHVTPPQTAPDFIRDSPLASSAGWVDVDGATLQHVTFKNVFSLGDAAGTTNAKTAAAIRKQAPVVLKNLLAERNGGPLQASYDGYGSCPLTVSYGKIVLAEFLYGGKVAPSFPLDPRVPRTTMWYLKTKLLPRLYWDYMLKGSEIDLPHKQLAQ